ncbi:hypothetical protein JCM16303_007419 [Sporobolomyces ruberrimus]
MPTLSELPDDEPTTSRRASSSSANTAGDESTSEPCRNESTPGVENEDNSDEGLAELSRYPAVTWTREELCEIVKSASALKAKGNAEFGHGQWELALGTYREALGELPPPLEKAQDKGKGKARATLEAGAEQGEDRDIASRGAQTEGIAASSEDEEREIASLQAVLSSNVAACLLKLNRWKDAVKACNDALAENPTYFKALHRRAMANESIGSWSSLSASLEDFNHLATLPDVTPLLSKQIKLAQARIPKAIEVQQQKDKDEVLGKLKNLGNTVLGKFGFSLDNFKMQEQPGGGYSMNFQQ